MKTPDFRASLLRVSCWALLYQFILATSPAVTTLTQFGITWTFDRDYPSGQFANGDYWVVGPVQIVSISPGSKVIDGRTINGSMVNPAGGPVVQGYDSATYGVYGPAYDSKLNVALGISSATPLKLPPGSSLISSISNDMAGQRPQLRSAAVLTVLKAGAPAGSFRPPYAGTIKDLTWNSKQLDYSRLLSLPKVPSTPALATVEGYFAKPWIEHCTSWMGRYIHPTENQPDYGRDIANLLAEGLLSLQLDYTNEQKERLLIRLVQYGIDVYGVARVGGVWEDLGGHNQGRKMPMLLAGCALNDANILDYANAGKHMIFQEDRQIWYVTQSDVGRPLYHDDGRSREEYLQMDVGIPEWGEQHTKQPNRDGRNWDAYYRLIVGPSILGHILAARLSGAQELWNRPAVFDYMDRYWVLEKDKSLTGADAMKPFMKEMWIAYRSISPPRKPVQPRPPSGFRVLP